MHSQVAKENIKEVLNQMRTNYGPDHKIWEDIVALIDNEEWKSRERVRAVLMFDSLKKADEEYFFSALKKTVLEAQEIYGLVLDKVPARDYIHIEDPSNDSEIISTVQDDDVGEAINPEEIDVAINAE